VIDWPTIQNALFDWVSCEFETHFGMVVGVSWAGQKRPRNTYPHATLQWLTGDARNGQIDTLVQTYDPAADAGEEITLSRVGERTRTLTIQVFGRPDCFAEAIDALGELASSMDHDEVRDPLRAACCAIFLRGDVINLGPDLRSDAFVPRASLDVGVRATSVSTRTAGYIDTINLSGADPAIDTTLEVP